MSNTSTNSQDDSIVLPVQGDLFQFPDLNLEILNQENIAAVLTGQAMDKLEVIMFGSTHEDLNILSYEEREPLQRLLSTYTEYVLSTENFIKPESSVDYQALMVALEHITFFLAKTELLRDPLYRDKLRVESLTALHKLEALIRGPLPIVIDIQTRFNAVIPETQEFKFAA